MKSRGVLSENYPRRPRESGWKEAKMYMYVCDVRNPTLRELLQAATVITRPGMLTLDGALAHKLEMVLASFARQMRLEDSESRSMVSES